MIIGISGKKGAGKDLAADLINEILQERKSIQFIRKKFADKLKDIVCLILGCTREQLEDRDYKEKELGPEWNRYMVKYKNSTYIFSTLEEQENFINSTTGSIISWVEKLTPRLLLQLLGTECGKEIIHPKIWVNSLISSQYPNWLITDVRFPDEVDCIKQKQGIVIRINRHFDIIRYEEAVKEFHKGSSVFILYPDNSEALIEDLDTLDYYLKDSLVKFGFERNFDTHKSETSLDDYTNFDYVIENDGSIEDLKTKLENILVELKLI